MRAAMHFTFLLAFLGGVIFSHRLSTLADSAASAAEDRAVITKSSVDEEASATGVYVQRALLEKEDLPPDEKVGDDGKKCWIFTHLPKSGGSTIRDLMRSKWTRASYIKYGNPEWKKGEKRARRILGEEWRVIAGSHAEALRRYGGERCQWFTMFRHPIARVVSAYFYCKRVPVDPLCATNIINANRVDLLTFAQHWGNFGLRLLSLSFGDLSPDKIMIWAKNNGKPVRAPGWFLQRKFMEAHSDRHNAPDAALYGMFAPVKALVNKSFAAVGLLENFEATLPVWASGWSLQRKFMEVHSYRHTVPDAALYDMLAPVKELVNTSFAAVGLLENFEATLLLFDRALQMPGETWPQWYRKIGKRNVGEVNKREEEAALKQARKDPRFKHFLKLDLELYDHAVKVHHEMLERYGVK